jgi:hypothetical protein
MKIPFLSRKKKVLKPEDISKRLDTIPTRESIEGIVREISKSKERKELWKSLSPRQREKVLRHIVERRLIHGKK